MPAYLAQLAAVLFFSLVFSSCFFTSRMNLRSLGGHQCGDGGT